VLAELLERVEAQTPYGGRAVTYDGLGVVWLDPGRVSLRERSDGQGARRLETLEAVVRVDPRLAAGRVLRFGGADWAIAGVGKAAGSGRVTLRLERDR
jgi:hypothetical protein